MRTNVTMIFSSEVPEGYGPHELADAVKFHVGLSELDAIEADVSDIDILKARELGLTDRQIELTVVVLDAAAQSVQSGTDLRDQVTDPLAFEYVKARRLFERMLNERNQAVAQ